MATFINKKERRNTHVLGFSRYMVPVAFVAAWQVLLVRDPGSADRSPGTPLQFKVDVVLQTRAFLSSRRAAC